MRAVTDPSRTLIVAPLTARMPSKRLTTSRGVKTRPVPPSVTEDHRLPLAEYPLRAERHEEDQRDADEDEPQGRDLDFRERQLEEPQPLEDRPEDDRSRRHPPVVREPAEDEHRIA